MARCVLAVPMWPVRSPVVQLRDEGLGRDGDFGPIQEPYHTLEVELGLNPTSPPRHLPRRLSAPPSRLPHNGDVPEMDLLGTMVRQQ